MTTFILWIGIIVAIVFLVAVFKKNQLREKEAAIVLEKANKDREQAQKDLDELKATQQVIIEKLDRIENKMDHSNG
ncbi:hypothetical protein ABC345_02925 [Shouchella sp. 1P09AA]|uniref:hypothetical protein n=1 Tax=unclassified Shouchella TaxID=2893065 RepID=UPI00399F7321